MESGHVTGGVVFGYANRTIMDGARCVHVERVIEPHEAAVVRRIFALAADGWGVKRIAAALNVDGAPAPSLDAMAAPEGGRRRQSAKCCTGVSTAAW